MRKTHADLPSTLELAAVLENEISYPIPKENSERHFVDLDNLIFFWNSMGLDTSVFSDETTRPEKLLEIFNRRQAEFVEKVLSTARLNTNRDNFDRLYNYLSPVNYQVGQKADIIFVHGSSSLARAEAAVRLFKEGASERIMFSGKGPIYDVFRKPEALAFREYALRQDVPQEAIWVEPKSITLVDNIKRTLVAWEKMGFQPRNILVVCSEIYLRRCLGYWQKYTVGIEVLTYGSEPPETATKENWYKSEDGARRIYAEIMKLSLSYRGNII